MPRPTKATDYKLVFETVPERRSIYRDLVHEFLESGEESCRVDGQLAESLKPGSIVTSLQQARRGLPVQVKNVDGKIYLKRKPLKEESSSEVNDKPKGSKRS